MKFVIFYVVTRQDLVSKKAGDGEIMQAYPDPQHSSANQCCGAAPLAALGLPTHAGYCHCTKKKN